MPHALALTRLFALAAATVLSGCLCPPCPEAVSASGAPDLPSGARLLVWDGDGKGIEGGKSWSDCDAKPTCKAKAEPKKGAGKDGSVGLVYQAEGPKWNGFGWNWFGWYPEDAGTDIRGYDQVSFMIKIEAKSPDAAPEQGSLAFNLGCSKGKKTSAGATVAKYADNAFDGQWHKVTIPLSDLYMGKEGAEFDPSSAWEFRLSTWNPSPRNFTITLDDVTFEKR